MSIVNHNWNHRMRAIITLLFLDRTHGRDRRLVQHVGPRKPRETGPYRNRSKRPSRNRLKQAAHRKRYQENRADAGQPSGPKRLSDANRHFAIGLVRFHCLVCLTNIVELKDASRFGLIDSSGRFIHDGLKRNVRDWKVWSAEYKAAKKCEVNSARHLKQSVLPPKKRTRKFG
jgi:hypothetical protein